MTLDPSDWALKVVTRLPLEIQGLVFISLFSEEGLSVSLTSPDSIWEDYAPFTFHDLDGQLSESHAKAYADFVRCEGTWPGTLREIKSFILRSATFEVSDSQELDQLLVWKSNHDPQRKLVNHLVMRVPWNRCKQNDLRLYDQLDRARVNSPEWKDIQRQLTQPFFGHRAKDLFSAVYTAHNLAFKSLTVVFSERLLRLQSGGLHLCVLATEIATLCSICQREPVCRFRVLIAGHLESRRRSQWIRDITSTWKMVGLKQLIDDEYGITSWNLVKGHSAAKFLVYDLLLAEEELKVLARMVFGNTIFESTDSLWTSKGRDAFLDVDSPRRSLRLREVRQNATQLADEA